MNAAQNAVQVIARFDTQNNRPVVFLAEEDAVNKPMLKAYIPGMGMQEVSHDFYNSTQRLSYNDTAVAIRQYQTAMGVKDVISRQRLTYKKNAPVVDRLTPVGGVIPQETMQKAIESAPQEQKAMLQAVADSQPPVNKRRQAALLRHQKDAVNAAVTNAKSLPADATEDQKKAVADAIAASVSNLVLQMLKG